MNANARHRITKRVTAVVQAQNIFNTQFYTFGVLGNAAVVGSEFTNPRFYSPGAPRAAWVGLDVTF